MKAPAEPKAANGSRVDLAVALGLLALFGIAAYAQYEPYTFLHGDGTFYANINKSLLRDGSLDQGSYHPRSWLEDDLGGNRDIDQGWSNVSLGAGGRWLPKHSFVLPLFSTPFYWAFDLAGLLVFHVGCLTLLMLAAYQVARTWLHPGVAAVATFAVAAQPIVTSDVYAYNNDVFYSALLLCGVWAWLRERYVLAGLLLGAGVWAKVTNVLFVAPFAVWLVCRWDARKLLRALAAFLLPVLLMGACNWHLFGSPLATSYGRIIVRKEGLLMTESISERFREPWRDHIEKVLLDDAQGLVPKAPLLLLTLPGLLLLSLRGRSALAMALSYLAVLAAFLAIHAKYHYLYSRFFLPVAGLGVLPLGALLGAAGPEWRHRLRYWLHPMAGGRLNPIFPAAVVAFIALLVLLGDRLRPPRSDAYRLSDHVESARVTAGGGQRCDYFNNMRQKWECWRDPSHDYFWGVALGDQCKFDGKPRRMLWLHAPPHGRERRMTFDGVPRGERLILRYGLAETSRFDDVRLEMRVNGDLVDLPPIERRGQLTEHVLEPPPLAEDANTLEILVRQPPYHWRHLCLDAVVE